MKTGHCSGPGARPCWRRQEFSRETLARCRPQAFVRAGRIRPDRRRLYALFRRVAGMARPFAGRDRRAAFGWHALARDRGAGDGHHRRRAQRPARHDARALWRDVSRLRRAQSDGAALSHLHGRGARQYRGRCGFAAARKRERAACPNASISITAMCGFGHRARSWAAICSRARLFRCGA